MQFQQEFIVYKVVYEYHIVTSHDRKSITTAPFHKNDALESCRSTLFFEYTVHFLFDNIYCNRNQKLFEIMVMIRLFKAAFACMRLVIVIILQSEQCQKLVSWFKVKVINESRWYFKKIGSPSVRLPENYKINVWTLKSATI